MSKKRILIEDDMTPMDAMQNSIDFCLAELLLRSDLLHSHDWNDITGKPNFHAVSTTGSYDDLTDKPVIPIIEPQVQSNWVQLDNSQPDFIKNKPTIPEEQVQSDWSQTNNSMVDFIKNKPVKSFSRPARSLNTSFQPSVDRDAFVAYSVNVTTVAALLVGARARMTLQYADNSAMTTNLVNLMIVEGGTGSGLVVTSYHTLLVAGMIPAGKYVRLATENVIGSPTYGSLLTQEVLI